MIREICKNAETFVTANRKATDHFMLSTQVTHSQKGRGPTRVLANPPTQNTVTMTFAAEACRMLMSAVTCRNRIRL